MSEIDTINMLLARRRERGALTVQEQRELQAAAAAAGPLKWRAWLGECELSDWCDSQEEAMAEARRELEKELSGSELAAALAGVSLEAGPECEEDDD